MSMNPAEPGAYPMASLYVGDLHPEITEAMLFEKFSTAGPVLSIRVCRDMITRRSLGYAYVNFQQPVDAERALDTMNFDTIKGRPIRIIWSQSDPTLRKSGVGKVFTKILDKSINKKDLYDIFFAFGNILSCKIVWNKHGSRNSRRYGIVDFETEEAARNAIKKVNGMLLNGKRVFVCRFMNRRERLEMMGDKVKKFNNVYVKNLSEDVDDDGLRNMFELYGKIISAKVMTTFDGKKRGFGFVSFEEPESAERAVEEMNGKELRGKLLFACRAQKKAERQAELKEKFERIKMERINHYQGVNLYVKNLDGVIDDERLRKEFSQFGTITSAKVMTENGRTKGFGFVRFSSPEEANKALTEMNDRIVVAKPLYVAFAQRKEDRKAHLASQYMQRIASMRMQTQQMGQMFQAGGAAGYFVPTMPQAAQRGFFAPQTMSEMSEMRAGPRWPTVRPGQPVSQTGGFQNMPAGPQVRPTRPAATAQPNMRPNAPVRVITGQNTTQPRATMPVTQSNVLGRPTAANVPPQQARPYKLPQMRNVPQTQHMGQMSQAGGAAGYFVPTMPQAAQRGFFAPQTMPEMRAGPRWPTVRPGQPASQTGGFQNYPAGPQVRPPRPAATAQPNMRPSAPMRAITGQNTTQPRAIMPITQSNVQGHPTAANVPPQQARPYKLPQMRNVPQVHLASPTGLNICTSFRQGVSKRQGESVTGTCWLG